MELQGQCEILHRAFPGCQMTVPTVRLGLVKFWPEVTEKNTSLVKWVGIFRRTATDEQAGRKRIEDELAKLEESVTVSEGLKV